MPTPTMVDGYLDTLIRGDRKACRDVFMRLVRSVTDVNEVYHDLLWPAMERLDKLFMADRVNQATQQMATRINRCLADQLQPLLPQLPANGKRILITCAQDEPEELGAQMCADLFEARGWDVFFLGGGVPNDEVLSLVGQLRPEILLVFGTKPCGVPQVRALIDLIRSVGSNPTMNIMISGGVFSRADGLWREVNADIYAANARQAIPLAESAVPRKAEIRLPGVPKKRRRRRRPALMAAQCA